MRFKSASSSLKWTVILEEGVEYLFKREEIWCIYGKKFNKEEETWEKDSSAGKMFKTLKDLVLDTDSSFNNEKWIIIATDWAPARASAKEIFHYA